MPKISGADFADFYAFCKDFQGIPAEFQNNFVRTFMNRETRVMVNRLKKTTPRSNKIHVDGTPPLADSWVAEQVRLEGTTFKASVSNPRYYATWIEYGHATTNGGWVSGVHMVQEAEDYMYQDITNKWGKQFETWIDNRLSGRHNY